MKKEVYILSAVRSPIGKFLGSFSYTTAVEIAIQTSKEAIRRAGTNPEKISMSIFGCGRQAGLGTNIARQIALGAALPNSSTAYTLNMACASGLKSIAMLSEEIKNGICDAGLCGGTENMTRVPFMINDLRFGIKLGNAKIDDGMYRDGFMCPVAHMLMGETAEQLAKEKGITREKQDKYALQSQERCEKARKKGLFDEEIAQINAKDQKGKDIVVVKDEHPRDGTKLEDLAKLPPVFSKDGTVTAGNASGITDGAAAMILASGEWATKMNLKPMARVVDFTAVGVDPTIMGIGPVPAVNLILERNNLKFDDIDLVEINEAFAAQILACDRELHFDWDKTNVNGGAIALGHPIGCTGSRIVVTLIHEMKRRHLKKGLATLCVSGGLGAALLVETL